MRMVRSATLKPRVLIVEDDEMVAMVASEMLHLLGYSSLCVDNGKGALSVCQQEPGSIGCALLDIGLPGLNGVEVCARLKDIDPRIRVILMSGDASRLPRPASGCDGVLRKPFNARELSRVLDHVNDRNGHRA